MTGGFATVPLPNSPFGGLVRLEGAAGADYTLAFIEAAEADPAALPDAQAG